MAIWHTLDNNAVFSALHTSSLGITEQDAQDRLLQDGPNTLSNNEMPSPWRQFVEQLYNPLIGILSCAAVMKVALQQWSDVCAILFVIVFNAALGFFQERKAENSLKELRKINALKAHVIRNELSAEIDAAQLVRGDCIVLESGTKIPADARIIESHYLEVDESLMTGESIAVPKSVEPVMPITNGITERPNMVFSGTIVTRGRAKAIVVATGAHTYLAKIAKLTVEATPPTSPLKERLEQFGKSIGILTLILMGVIIAIGFYKGFSIPELIMTCVSLTVSAIPEGLPIAVTVVLSFGLLAMARKQAVIRKLPAVETLGCTTVICTDKTGTLTQNHMEVVEGIIGCSHKTPFTPEPLMWASRIARYASEAQETLSHEIIGDPVDAALLRFAKKSIHEDLPWKKELIIPFESDRRMMASSITSDQETFLL